MVVLPSGNFLVNVNDWYLVVKNKLINSIKSPKNESHLCYLEIYVKLQT